MADEPILLKGIREGLLLTIKPEAIEWSELMSRVAQRIDEQRAFFKGAKLAVDVGSRPVRPHELDSLKIILSNREIKLWAVISDSDTTKATAKQSGLETSLVAGDDESLETPAVNPEETGTPGVMINRTLRNGRTIRSRGHVVVYGDVNPGAQIIAEGSVIVWGKLRGIVHAGANGDTTAVVCALDLSPTQLRIANFMSVSPEEKRRKTRPEVALVRDGRIVAEAWTDS